MALTWTRTISRSLRQLLLPSASQTGFQQDRSNAHRASLGRVSRTQYLRRYPVTIVRPDGSSLEIRAAEPRQVVQLAVDLKSLSDDQRRQRLAARKPKVKKIKQEVIDDNFDASEYMQMWGAGASESTEQAAKPQTTSNKKAKSGK